MSDEQPDKHELDALEAFIMDATDEEIDTILRNMGYDPDKVGKDFAEFAREMSKKYTPPPAAKSEE